MRITAPPLDAEPERRPVVCRGEVKGFSRKSANRLREKIAQVDQSACGDVFFTTLTYPAQFSADRQEWYAQLRAFVKRMRREFPEIIATVWKLEPQKRLAPHFHLIVITDSIVTDARAKHLQEFTAWAWYEVVGTNRREHLRAGTQVQRMKSWKGVGSYASKYLAKTVADNLPDWWGTGRWWGVFGELPTDLQDFNLTRSQFFALRRLICKSIEKKTGRRPRIGSAGQGVAAFWDEKTSLKVLEWVYKTIYTRHHGERIPDMQSRTPDHAAHR